MKLKFNKTLVLALIVMFLMVGSSVIYGFLQVITPASQESQVELPSTNIVDYELTPDQVALLLRKGKTVMRYEYSLNCMECLSQKTLLEQLTNQFPDQIYLQEIVTNSVSLKMNSYYGEKTIKNITQDTVVDGICQLMTSPPVGCVRRMT